MTIEELISQLQALVADGVEPGAPVAAFDGRSPSEVPLLEVQTTEDGVFILVDGWVWR